MRNRFLLIQVVSVPATTIFARKEVTFLASRASPWQFTVPHSMPMSTHSKDMQAVSLIFKHECEYVNK